MRAILGGTPRYARPSLARRVTGFDTAIGRMHPLRGESQNLFLSTLNDPPTKHQRPERTSPGVGLHRSGSVRRITPSRRQVLLRSLAASGSHLTAGAAGEAAVGSLNAARLLRSAARLVGRAATWGSALGTHVAARLAASLAARGSRMAAAGACGRLRPHAEADQSQDSGTDQRHY